MRFIAPQFLHLAWLALIPLALRGVAYKPAPASKLLLRNLMIYGAGGLIVRIAAVGALAWVTGFVLFTATLPDATPLAVATDGVVVLTGGPNRIDRGLEILKAGKSRKVVTT